MGKSNLSIAIDGPAAAGKSTVAKKVAQQLKYIYIDTGAMYRALTWKALENKVDVENEERLAELLLDTEIELRQTSDGQRVMVDGRDVSEEIRKDLVTGNVSAVAKHASVREEMVRRQRTMSRKAGVVMDGRDIGTHVLPSAELKFFLIASVEERAFRRHKENQEKGFPSDLNQLKKEIERRDKLDSEREASPLVKAEDAIELDTTSLTIEEVTSKILDEVKKVKS